MTRTLYDECESGNVEEAQQMILNGADVNMTNDEDNDNNYSNDYEVGHLCILLVVMVTWR